MPRLPKGTYRMDGHVIEVTRDLGVGDFIRRTDFILDGQPMAESDDRIPDPIVKFIKKTGEAMSTYHEVLAKIAAHLTLHHGVATQLAGEAAAKLVSECGLSTILVQGIMGTQPRSSPREPLEL